jgi:DNA-binding LacI/PurR family transcriptional regulator
MKRFTSTASSNGLADELRKLVAGMPPGARLPTVRGLMGEYGVSQHLVQSALEQLRSDGSITSFVGRGTFVGTRAVPTAPVSRSVLTLVYDSPYERSEVIASTLHRALIHRGYESMIVTYHDHTHAMDVLRGGRRYDACVLQPRMTTIHGAVLALLRDIGDIVIIEGHSADGLDVDAISNDPGTCVELALQHLIGLGHRRIAWVTEANDYNFFKLCVRFFEMARSLVGLGAEDMPVISAPMSRAERNFEDLAGALRPLFEGPAGAPTAVVVASFSDGATVLGAFKKLGLDVPGAVSVIKIGTPDIASEHIERLAIIGRPTFQVTESVLARLEWRWRNRGAAHATVYDQPILAPSLSTAPPQAQGHDGGTGTRAPSALEKA